MSDRPKGLVPQAWIGPRALGFRCVWWALGFRLGFKALGPWGMLGGVWRGLGGSHGLATCGCAIDEKG